MSERSRLQTELQAVLVEAESLRATCSRLEQDKAALLERMGAMEHQQVGLPGSRSHCCVVVVVISGFIYFCCD